MVVVGSDDGVPDFVRIREEIAHLRGESTVATDDVAALQLHVVGLESLRDGVHVDLARGHPLLVEPDTHLARVAADDIHVGHIGHFLDFIAHDLGQLTELEAADAVAPQREGQHRDVVDGP